METIENTDEKVKYLSKKRKWLNYLKMLFLILKK